MSSLGRIYEVPPDRQEETGKSRRVCVGKCPNIIALINKSTSKGRDMIQESHVHDRISRNIDFALRAMDIV